MWNRVITFKKVCLVGVALLLSDLSFGQEITFLMDQSPVTKQSFSDTLSRVAFTNDLLLKKIQAGYPFVKVDSVTYANTWLSAGSFHKLQLDSIIYLNEQISYSMRSKEAVPRIESELKNWVNRGYPFTTIKLENFQTTVEGDLQANLVVDKGPLIRWDSIIFSSPINTHRKFIYQTIGIQKGTAFSEEAFEAASRRLSRVSFLEEKSAPDISFGSGKALLYLDLAERAFNSFEGVVGVLSNGQSGEGLLLTGYLNLHLGNLFYSGKSLDLSWQRYGVQSQVLDLAIGYPYPADSRLLTEVGFHLLKQDTSYLNQSFDLGIGSYIGSSAKFSAGYKRATGSLISPDLDNLQRNLADFTQDNYSIGLDFRNFQAPFGFRSDLKTFTSVSIGQKRILKNPALPESFYDSLKEKSAIYSWNVGLKAQKIITTHGAISSSLSTAGILNQYLFNSELSRLGGLKTLRGFNENQFFASKYFLSRLEWRQYFESTSYFLIFYDQLVMENKSSYQAPFGVGLGFVLNTNSGLLNFAMGVGGTKQQPPDLATIKVHIGYQATF